ncbi:MAG: carbohydrate ABC transporter permease [Eubacteriales bacterium]|nr:carbohydrate ABC transporter permease [Eubacteriales bacterium]
MASGRKMRKLTTEDVVFDSVNYILLMILCVATLYPFINTMAISLNDATDAIRGHIYLVPREFSIRNYEVILTENKNITNSLFISAARAVTGAVTSMFACLMVAYTLSRRDFVLRKFLTKFLVYTMYFSGGIIPVYLLMRQLGLINNFLVYILPTMVSAYNVMIMRSYIEGMPDSLIEAAKIDGASEYRVLFKIIMPLSLPVIATIILFVAVTQWNSWFDTMLYCSSRPKLSTLQFELQKLLSSTRTMTGATADAADALGISQQGMVTPNSIRAAMTIIATVPILFSYPFLQKYFVKGLTLGGVKG